MLATSRDVQSSIALIAIFALVSIVGAPRSVLDAILNNGTMSRAIWLVGVVALLFSKFYLTAVLLTVLGLHLSFTTHSSYAFSHDGILSEYAAAQSKDPRFATDNLDVALANGTLPLDPARWRDPGRSPIPLLLFPPTETQLSLASNNGY